MRTLLPVLLFPILLSSFANSEQLLPSVTSFHSLILDDGSELQVFMKCPQSLPLKPVPAVLVFGGFETGARSLELLPLHAQICLVTFAYPFTAPAQLNLFSAVKALPLAKAAIHHTLEGVEQLVNWVKTRGEIDPRRIVLVGASVGSPFASIVASRRADIAALILVHGFGDVEKVISHSLKTEWKPKLGPIGTISAWLAGKSLWWYVDIPAPEKSLRQLDAHQRVLIFTAKEDDLLPDEATNSLREGLLESKVKWREISLPGGHMRPHQEVVIERFLKDSMQWLREEKLLD